MPTASAIPSFVHTIDRLQALGQTIDTPQYALCCACTLGIGHASPPRQGPCASGRHILIVIGHMHREDIEAILGGTPEVTVTQPSRFGYPSPEAVAAATTRADLCAIASFNLLGGQPKEGPVAWDWLQRVVARLEEQPTAETLLFRARLDVLTAGVGPEDAAQHCDRVRVVAQDHAGNTGGVPRASQTAAGQTKRAWRRRVHRHDGSATFQPIF